MTNRKNTNTTYLSKKVLLIGNGINNLNNEQSWDNLVDELRKKVRKENDANDLIKEFPLIFENLLNIGIRNNTITNENELKEIVANSVNEIQPNSIHDRINKINPEHIITTNYDFVLERTLSFENTSAINETRFSIFRRFSANGRNFWHIHGDSQNPKTINLGFEHYSGQLQYLRNYVVSGTHYTSKKIPKESLVKRFKLLPDTINSWIDLLFTREIHIIGLRLDFIEIDLWWLLTYRSKLKSQKGFNIRNKIYYYIPKKYAELSKGKIELLENMSVDVRIIDKTEYDYYNEVLNYIEKRNYS